MTKSRTEASIRNVIISIAEQLITLLLMFVQRTFLIKYLATEYLGIEGLFTNILSLLSMLELGFGSALVYSMYKPMAENDEEKINLLMKLYAKIYNTIGTITLIVGFSLAPFLNFFIKEMPNISNISLIYCMYVLNTALSYFFVYKSSIITVAQNQYIITINKFIFTVIQNIVQIFVLVFLKNYIIYYLITIIFTLFTNISISIIANKQFPFIKNKSIGKLSKKEVKEIKNYVSAIFINKVGWTILNGTDNLLISKYIGVVVVGIYSNYLLIINAIHGLIQRVFTSITASVGNLGTEENAIASHKVFKKVLMITNILAGTCSKCLYILLNPFIYMWIGENFVFSNITVALIVTIFYIETIRRAAYTFYEAYGLFIHFKYKPVFEGVTNLAISIILGKLIGVNGILLGTIISLLLFTFWIEPYILYKYVFNKKVKSYFLTIGKYFIIFMIEWILCFVITSFFKSYTIVNFILKCIVCLSIPTFVYYILLKNTEEFNFFIDLKDKLLNKLKGTK